MTKILCRFVLLSLLLMAPVIVKAHALDPGFLSLTQSNGENWKVFWRKPDVKGQPMALSAKLPEGCIGTEPINPRFDGAAWVTEWTVQCLPKLQGGRIRIDGLDATRTDVLIRIAPQNKSVQSIRLTASDFEYEVPEDFTIIQVFSNYLSLGFEHILEGFDHLLFVFALLLLVQTPRRLIGAITAFTVAHSITLAFASLGLLRVPAPPVEAIIALSITFLALEILRQKAEKPTITQAYPWIVAFSFGLLHGLGFAGALTQIGLPTGDIPVALLAFNVGVELGQLTFVFAVLTIFLGLKFIAPQTALHCKKPHSFAMITMGYFIGILSLYWLSERVAGFPIFAS